MKFTIPKPFLYLFTFMVFGVAFKALGEQVVTGALRYNVATVSYAASTAIDFASNPRQSVTLGGNVTFTTSNLAAGRGVLLRVVGDGSNRTLTFPAWTFLGGTPSTLTANKTMVCDLMSWSTTDASVSAACAIQP